MRIEENKNQLLKFSSNVHVNLIKIIIAREYYTHLDLGYVYLTMSVRHQDFISENQHMWCIETFILWFYITRMILWWRILGEIWLFTVLFSLVI